MLVNLENISKYYNGNMILDKINFTIEDNDRIGLVGVNGCGKSTLLKIIVGEEEYDNDDLVKGNISKAGGLTIGYLKQNYALEATNTIDYEMHSVFSKLLDVQSEMRTLEEKIADAHTTNDDILLSKLSDEYASKSTYFEAQDGYNIDVKINMVLNGMGFENFKRQRVISTLSGGEKTRLALARILLENPKLLILDEPTNHLDFKTLNWLESYLSVYKGALLIVSHDRYFLNKICTKISEIENKHMISFKGDYNSYKKQKEFLIDTQIKEYEQQQAKLAQLQEYIDKNKVRASTANMAKSRQNMMDKIERIDKPVIYKEPPKFSFKYDIVPPKEILKVQNLKVEVGNNVNTKVLMDNISFEVRRGEKVGIIGPNGIGKSSLLKVLLGKIPHRCGCIEWNNNIKISYFDQENAQLDFENTVIEELHRRYPRDTELMVRNLLAKVGLVGENVFKKVGVISGGERAKLCFAIMMHERGNVLVMDEPSNHLDLLTKEVLEDALSEFDGTIIFVSHDRYLLNKVSNCLLVIDNNEITKIKGNYDTYQEEKLLLDAQIKEQEEKIKAENALEKAKSEKVVQFRSKQQRAEEAKIKSRIKNIENIIEELQSHIKELEESLNNSDIQSDYLKMNEVCKDLEESKNKMSELYDEWIELQE